PGASRRPGHTERASGLSLPDALPEPRLHSEHWKMCQRCPHRPEPLRFRYLLLERHRHAHFVSEPKADAAVEFQWQNAGVGNPRCRPGWNGGPWNRRVAAIARPHEELAQSRVESHKNLIRFALLWK